jgi:hypothetical protein
MKRKLTDRQKINILTKALKIYANIDFWQYRDVGNKGDPRYTSLEVVDSKDGKIKDGWEWAEEALIKVRPNKYANVSSIS